MCDGLAGDMERLGQNVRRVGEHVGAAEASRWSSTSHSGHVSGGS